MSENIKCTCQNTKCIRYRKCKECIGHHKVNSNNKLPHCQRPGNKEISKKVEQFAHVIC